MEAFEVLHAWWRKTDVWVDTRATPKADLQQLEARYEIILPGDFRRYLTFSAPTGENWDDEMGNWWPISRTKNIPDEYAHRLAEPIAKNAAKHLFFLDHCIWCWAWAISCADDNTYGKVAVIGGSPDRYVADDFIEFVKRYTGNWASVCP